MMTPQEYQLPVIDLSQPCAKENIFQAAKKYGLLQVVNHGISRELLGNVTREAVKLFETPLETRARSGLLNNSSPWGTSPAQFSHHVPLVKIYDPSCHGQFTSLGGVMRALAPAMFGLARTLAGVLEESLGHQGRSTLNEKCDDNTCFLRLIQSPVCPLSPERFWPLPHADSDFLTILYQDQVGGLRLLKDSRFVVVKPIRDALVVSIGDLLQAWSNDVYRSVEQKVEKNREVERYSVAFSLCPSPGSQIGRCRKPSVYRKFTCGEYRKQVQEDIKRTCRKVGLPRFRQIERNISDVSTELVFYDDPWRIRKKLTKSDLDQLSRLLLPQDCVKAHVLRWMKKEMVGKVESKEGMEVDVINEDTGGEHRLVFRYWASSGCYVLNGGWSKLFVNGGKLNIGDEIGMYWDTISCKFHFTVLQKVACGTSNPAA
ncbi:gibberellin 2-beta-dioxygenase 6-like [Rutidosis leptorrhynchoides]|uniref:gibberellin 2-beta-dioxygenase 6-like n=1 Tax=Rutidosis leptorrhynchoides TaxID=125765 RepID=UPI003A98DDFD